MGKLQVRYRHEESGSMLSVSVERMVDGFCYNFAIQKFNQVVTDPESLIAMGERTPDKYNGQERYRKLYCLDFDIKSPADWVDGEYMLCVHDVGPGTVPEALQPIQIIIYDGDSAPPIVRTSGNLFVELNLHP